MKNSLYPLVLASMLMGGGMPSRPTRRIPRGNTAGQGGGHAAPVKTLNEYNIHGEIILAENKKTAQKIYQHQHKKK